MRWNEAWGSLSSIHLRFLVLGNPVTCGILCDNGESPEFAMCPRSDLIPCITMRDFPSCFGESGVQVSDSSSGASRSTQNLVTCLYKAQLLGRSCVIHVTWNKTLMGQGLSVGIDDFANQRLCKVEIKPSLFSKRKGSKILEVENSKIVIFWDISVAKFGLGPEPLEGFYVAVVFDLEMVLLLGDLTKEAYRKTNTSPPPSNAVFIAKREHLYGKKVFYSTKAQFCDNGQSHEVEIECDTVGLQGPCLEIHIDRKRVMQIKRLAWKFRGNQTILVDGFPVEVFWDVHSWLFGPPSGSAVFVFQTCLSATKLLPWSTSQNLRESQLGGLGFSFILSLREGEGGQASSSLVVIHTVGLRQRSLKLQAYSEVERGGENRRGKQRI
ncbi:hypothetical protein C4D60_Mb06t21910 [Musa balbisiana]|uniref:DUF868 domain-containing protein n=1 Tax=Musa balbisiana TaxID=52838 RepID=A0A4V6T447_MUSBA|nr:hypothetical protein C4D60_Mb06t21910 [Musa balbisiana]